MNSSSYFFFSGDLEACRCFAECLYQQLLEQPQQLKRDSQLMASQLMMQHESPPTCHVEIYYLHQALSRPSDQLASSQPGLLQLHQINLRRGPLDPTEAALCLALAATRMRLGWPLHRRADLSAAWNVVSNAARRYIAPPRQVGVLQMIHVVSHLATVLPPGGIVKNAAEDTWTSPEQKTTALSWQPGKYGL
jgi:hypothetical protein